MLWESLGQEEGGAKDLSESFVSYKQLNTPKGTPSGPRRPGARGSPLPSRAPPCAGDPEPRRARLGTFATGWDSGGGGGRGDPPCLCGAAPRTWCGSHSCAGRRFGRGGGGDSAAAPRAMERRARSPRGLWLLLLLLSPGPGRQEPGGLGAGRGSGAGWVQGRAPPFPCSPEAAGTQSRAEGAGRRVGGLLGEERECLGVCCRFSRPGPGAGTHPPEFPGTAGRRGVPPRAVAGTLALRSAAPPGQPGRIVRAGPGLCGSVSCTVDGRDEGRVNVCGFPSILFIVGLGLISKRWESVLPVQYYL